MLIVLPPSMRVECSETTPHEEHLLERITILENTMTRLAERLEQGLKLLLRQSETSYANHELVKSLIAILNEGGVVDNRQLESKWRAECDKLDGEGPKPRKASGKSARKASRKAAGRR
jgi:hypothetical protein